MSVSNNDLSKEMTTSSSVHRQRRSVCVFGTSADPPTGTGGHLGIVSHLASLQPTFDEVRVIPVYRHMYVSKREKQASYHDRLTMCRLAFRDVPNVTVSDIERRCRDQMIDRIRESFQDKSEQQKSCAENEKRESVRDEWTSKICIGTADILDMLIAEEPTVDFSLALGSDTFLDLTDRKWKRSSDVIDLVNGRVIVIQRKYIPKYQESHEIHGGNLSRDETMEEVEHRIQALRLKRSSSLSDDHHYSRCEGDKRSSTEQARSEFILSLSDISSSQVRQMCSESSLRQWITPAVLQYIKDANLYAFGSLEHEQATSTPERGCSAESFHDG